MDGRSERPDSGLPGSGAGEQGKYDDQATLDGRIFMPEKYRKMSMTATQYASPSQWGILPYRANPRW